MAPVPLPPDTFPAETGATTFTSLPKEIQIRIYKEVFSKIDLKHDVLPRMRCENGGDVGSERFHMKFTPRHPLALLSVSKEIKLDAQPYAVNCPIFVEGNYRRGVNRISLRLPLPIPARRQVCSWVINKNDRPSRFIDFDGQAMGMNEYPNLRYVEFGVLATYLYLSTNDIQTLVEGNASESVMSRDDVWHFEVRFSIPLGAMIRANDCTVKLRVWLVKAQAWSMGDHVLNSSGQRMTAAAVWNRQGIRLSDVMPCGPACSDEPSDLLARRRVCG
ncbi:hypothetical protein AYL99_09682 [Fonsecaea erecta]|uniref:Uncharacterized protein n=1 Tax=Fonsecaea erecta TaxID=1367422 RepID=A0A178ZBE3_9EURO|nr:hypothetical protein AYL99_09682 [Fonsecaea erecta]OAP56503.1 hypothetical protein AYL99_09682 [Fonsecaea erecta]